MARLAWAVSIVLVVAACGGSTGESAGDNGADTTVANRASTTTTQPSPIKQDITRGFLDFWKVRVELLDPPNPDDPRIDAVMAEPARSSFVALLNDRLVAGTGTRLAEPSAYRQVVLSIAVATDGTTAQVRSCQVDDLVVYDLATDEVLNDAESVFIVDSEMALVDGVWKMSAVDTSEGIEEVGSCPDFPDAAG